MISFRTLLTGLFIGLPASIGFTAEVYPTAIFPFTERGAGVKGDGEKVSDILFAELVVNPDLHLVDRADLKKTLEEIELNLSGVVDPQQAVQVGQLTGAKVLVTGSIIEAGERIYIVAKIIGTETSRVLGQSVKGSVDDDIGGLVESLAVKVGEMIVERAGELVAKPIKTSDRIAAVKKAIGEDRKRPVLSIKVDERHIGRTTIDPASETEIALIAKASGFELLDGTKADKADIQILGEAFSEFATRRGNLISVKARLEVKAIDPKTKKVIAVDRQTVVEVDISEQIAGKNGLQRAGAIIAERMLPKLVK